MPKHDDPIGHAERACGLDVFEVAAAQELGAHEPHQRHPGKQQQNPKQHEKAGHQHGGNDQEQIKRGHGGPDFDEPLEQEIGPAAEIALQSAGRDADDG